MCILLLLLLVLIYINSCLTQNNVNISIYFQKSLWVIKVKIFIMYNALKHFVSPTIVFQWITPHVHSSFYDLTIYGKIVETWLFSTLSNIYEDKLRYCWRFAFLTPILYLLCSVLLHKMRILDIYAEQTRGIT